jgi:hypothetical protein
MKLKKVTVSISNEVLNSIYRECDKYQLDETGGRLIGYYRYDKKELEIIVTGEIGPGPNAKRSMTSFHQDGNSQEEIFRQLEKKYKSIEHLGNWHTHHVNGYKTLSGGDISTYLNIVNHKNHNTNFFYALLVTSKNNNSDIPPYNIKHFLFLRGYNSLIEIPDTNIKILIEPAIYVGEKENPESNESVNINIESIENVKIIRYYDKVNIQALFPNISPYYSKKIESIYWKGNINLINGINIKIIIVENREGSNLYYSVVSINSGFNKKYKMPSFENIKFETIIQALITIEREILKIFYK